MDADSQGRQLLDRMAVDFAQMVKRADVDYYVKSEPPPGSLLRTVRQPGNDQIAFYSTVPGYYPPGSQSPVSLVGYRVNSDSTSASYNKTERLGKGLVWNAATGDTAVVFVPIPLASPIPAVELPAPTPDPLPTPAWRYAGNMSPDPGGAYEVVGPQVFRFEYYYVLKDGTFSVNPIINPHNSLSGMQDVSAIVVDIAVIDAKSKVLLSDTTQIPQVASQLIDWGNTACVGCPTAAQWKTTPGLLRAQWQNALDASTLPRQAISGIRLYERFFYLSAPVL